MQTFTRKIGRNKGKPRLWLEGSILQDHGFPHGTRWNLETTSDGLLITPHPDGSRKVSGRPGRPVIDIAAGSLGAVGGAATVTLTLRPGFGLIVTPDADQPRTLDLAA